jgi:hypothetical protein
MAPQVNWCGTQDQLLELTAVVNRNCACAANSHQAGRVCGAHRMLWRDQRALDGLLFGRHIAERLRNEEFLAAPPHATVRARLDTQRHSCHGRRHRHPMSMLLGVALVGLGLALLMVQYAWLLFGISHGCLTRTSGLDCFALARPDLVVMWPIVGLLLLTCGVSLIGIEYFAGRSAVQNLELRTTGSVRDHQPSGSRTFAN